MSQHWLSGHPGMQCTLANLGSLSPLHLPQDKEGAQFGPFWQWWWWCHRCCGPLSEGPRPHCLQRMDWAMNLSISPCISNYLDNYPDAILGCEKILIHLNIVILCFAILYRFLKNHIDVQLTVYVHRFVAVINFVNIFFNPKLLLHKKYCSDTVITLRGKHFSPQILWIIWCLIYTMTVF